MTAEDKELVARLLVRWCAWRWMRSAKRGLALLWPPYPTEEKPGDWLPSPMFGSAEEEAYSMERLSEAPPIKERFSDWHRSCCREFPGRIESGMPRLTESLDACAMLKAAILAKGLCLQILIDPPSRSMTALVGVTIFDGKMRELARAISTDISDEALTICRAVDAIPED